VQTTRFVGLLAIGAVTALSATGVAPTVTLIPAAETTAAFVKGRPLVETGAYKVHASRRDAPGQAEVHVLDTDIIYVLDGTATIVTGGEAVDARETAANERRGPSIRGGTAQKLAKGDVFIVPNGMPHQFTDVQAPFLYYTVKVTSTAGGAR
jgi:mannose-6-phosphate isomerase-like protein (cupin superfamily)